MREIKFRAWCKEHGEMVYADTKHRISDKREFATLIFEVGFSHFPDADEWELMQFTTLLDENKKEMYEGDIFKDWQGKLSVIVWKYSGWAFEAINEPSFKYREGFHNIGEVIGNRFENPELMEAI